MIELINEEEVLDTTTGLVWKRSPENKLYTWNKLMSINFGEWRVPNIAELISIVDYSEYNPASFEPFIFRKEKHIFWTSLSYSGDKEFAWIVHFLNGYVSYIDKNNVYQVRLVKSKC